MAVALVLLIYGGLTTAGGVMGSFHPKINGSLIAGFASGAALIASGVLLLSGRAWGVYVGLAVNVLVFVITMRGARLV